MQRISRNAIDNLTRAKKGLKLNLSETSKCNTGQSHGCQLSYPPCVHLLCRTCWDSSKILEQESRCIHHWILDSTFVVVYGPTSWCISCVVRNEYQCYICSSHSCNLDYSLWDSLQVTLVFLILLHNLQQFSNSKFICIIRKFVHISGTASYNMVSPAPDPAFFIFAVRAVV